MNDDEFYSGRDDFDDEPVGPVPDKKGAKEK